MIIGIEDFKKLIQGFEKPLLTPKEANGLTYSIIELLMKDNCTVELLKLLSRYLSKSAYENIIEERIIGHWCGYPICNIQDDKIRDEVKFNKIAEKFALKSYYSTRYCCKDHYLKSEFYRRQLSEDALFMRIELDKQWFSDGSIENDIRVLE